MARRRWTVAALPVLLCAALAVGGPGAAGAVGASGGDRGLAADLGARFPRAGLGPGAVGEVVDAASGAQLWSSGAATGRMPASTAKLATAVAALTLLGPDHTELTSTRYRAADHTLYLVGGGDPDLDQDALGALAADTATALKARGLTQVTLRFDDSLFPAPEPSPGWLPDYYPYELAPVRALALVGERSADTALSAAVSFGRRLAAAGVESAAPSRAPAPPDAAPLAERGSPPLWQAVEYMLKVSDNNVAEELLRLTALARHSAANWQDGTAAVRAVLGGYRVPLDGTALYDGSGLSRADRMTPRALGAIAALTVRPELGRLLWPVFAGLPVAGRDGTLARANHRFDTPPSSCAAGLVHAKTGTLHDASALAGVARGPDGRWRAFAFLENGAVATAAARRGLDALAATVTGCW
ncbi:D-alanyl-D-alanine carboxypeptidase/D-alanyl-D-alanine-endopeptidase [Streptacidiphilus sp. P02-A3a]|uniref:D-alanyl-D-alanine carboxypeptidase/D-alanyl-D-alanine endopeptidase n=1 Tax=Streptacidiphilus sp. P02-A3a TaxID=2704468 RepID=UPI0015F81365|nr:D-alanyl-D-alanine carboxypeptidase/D-alanyl-D-alanine-endopeptidase [Streptacidiphilus sp. P02-A3a]QMU69521.1 D-alanyl-D-alanine carboxypeptidase/D-alanyl-D-alanine-endopeptidase [Streptacidiphilus sp. P02-A3a]